MKSRSKYFPASQAQNDWGLFVTCAGIARYEPGDEFPSREHPDEYYFTWERGRTLGEWQLCLVSGGCGEARFRDRNFRLVPGSLLVLPAGVWHRYRPDPQTGWSTRWAGFGGELAARLVECAGLRDGGVVDLSGKPGLRENFADAVSGFLETCGARPFSASARLHGFLAALVEERRGDGPEGAKARAEETVRLAQAAIAEKLGETLDLEALARSLGVPYRTFRHVFAKECGMPPHRWQLRLRLERAKRLLESSDMPVSEIAENLGFRSTWYFAHFFQRETGRSATRYRAESRAGRGGGGVV